MVTAGSLYPQIPAAVQVGSRAVLHVIITVVPAAQKTFIAVQIQRLTAEQKGGPAAVGVIAALVSVIKHQNRQLIFALVQVGGEVHLICPAASRQAFTEQTALKNRQPAVDIQPILGLSENQCLDLPQLG